MLKAIALTTLLLLAHSTTAQNIRPFTVTIDSVDCEVQPKRANLEVVPKHIFGFAINDLRVNRKGGTVGIIQPMHRYYAPSGKFSLYNNFLFTPFDFRQRYTNKEAYNFYRIEFSSTSTFYFSAKQKHKSSTMNISDAAGTIHPLKINWPSTIRFGARIGAEYQQYSMKVFEKKELSLNNQTIERTTELRGQRQTTISIGISRQQVKGVDCNFCSLGDYTSFNIREFYLDGLVSPYQQAFGAITDSTTTTSEQLTYSEGRISDFDYRFIKIGGRIGYNRIGTWARMPQIVLATGGEIGWYTGPALYNFELRIRLSVYILTFKGLLKELIL